MDLPSLLDNFDLQLLGLDSAFVWIRGIMSERKGAWRFSAVWTCPGHMVATTSTDPARLQRELLELDTELKRLVMERQCFPLYLRNVEFKYKLSDWELARTRTPIHLPVQGYIQSQHKHYSNLQPLWKQDHLSKTRLDRKNNL